MSRIFDISVINKNLHKGFYVTIFSMVQIGVLALQPAGAFALDFSMSIWKYGVHIHLVNAKDNRCLAIIKAKKQ